MKLFFRNIHLYLSLVAGLIIFGSCLTGTVLVFEKEIEHSLHPQRYYVKPQGAALPLSVIKASVLKQVPKAKLVSVMVYNNAERTIEAGLIVPEKKDKKQNGKPAEKAERPKGGERGLKGKKNQPERANLTLFVNPYTAEVVGQFSRRQSFLFQVEMYHRFLLAGKDSAGDFIVGTATLLFLFILITGVVLWWPKTKNIMRQRLKIKWNGSAKRLTHDLHIVTGFYTSLFLIVIVLTGLVMSFKWANNALFAITGSKPQKEQQKQPKSANKGTKPLSIDEAIKPLAGKLKTSAYYTIRIPRDSTGVYGVTILPEGAIENTSDTYLIDQYKGNIIEAQLFAEKSLGQRVRSMVKPVHTGAVYGLPTQIISFIVCALSLIFPVTGIMMWLNRIKVKKTDKRSLIKRPKPVLH